MLNSSRLLLLMIAVVLGSSSAWAKQEKALTKEQLREKIAKAFPRMAVDKLEKGPIDGLYQVIAAGELYYITDNGEHMMFGPLVSIKGAPVNLTQEKLAAIDKEKAPERVKALNDLKKGDFVTFKAKNEKHSITVFTDVDCGYCRKLHRDVVELNKLGITVKYLAFPRAGVPSESYNKLASVWCAKDQTTAMDEAKLNNKFDKSTISSKCESPIKDKHMPLVRQFGLRGTPAIVTETGDILPGYMPPQALLSRLEPAANKNAAK